MNNSSVISVPEGCVTPQFFPFIPWDNEHNLVPKRVDSIANLLLTGICVPLLYLVSLCTNIINMVVFYRHGLRERINACLFTLSLVDLLSITAAFAYGSDVLYMFAIGRESELGPAAQFFTRSFLVGLHGLMLSSQVVYTVVALERCLCITRPLIAKRFMSTKTTVVMLWTMMSLITGECVFMVGVQYSVVCVFDPADASVSYMSYPSELYLQNRVVINAVYTAFNGFLVPGLSFLCVTVCTVVTAVKLKELSRWRETVSSASGSVSSRDLALTRVIVGTSVLFIVCLVPSIVICAVSSLVPQMSVGGRYDNLAWVLRRLYQLSTAINNTFNFFIYYTCGSRFRETTHGLLSPLCRDRRTDKKTKCLEK